jgi:tight adherence protein B
VAQLHKGEVSFQFQRALAEVQFGARLDEALSRVSERMNNEDLKWLVLALEIHRELGGPLSEVVDSVAQTLTVRAELHREVRVLAAEGKLSALVLVAVPFVAFAALFVLRREYLSFFWTKPLGFAMLACFCALMLAGWIWLRSILKQE